MLIMSLELAYSMFHVDLQCAGKTVVSLFAEES